MHQIFNKLRPMFEKGGKFSSLFPLFEAQEAFLFIPATRTTSGCHVRDRLDTKRFMSMVIVALIPAFLFGVWNVGYQAYGATGQNAGVLSCFLLGARYVMPIVLVSYTAGGIWEVLFAVVRKHEINEGFLVTGLLFPLVLPPTIPLWQVAVAISFGVVIGKEVFGGTGMNVFNPALVARSFLFFAYPAQMSGEKVWRAIGGQQVVDAYSGATPLAVAAHHGAKPVIQALQTFGEAGHFANFSFSSLFLGTVPGSIGETSVLMILIGAVILIMTGVASWRIMLGVFAGGAAMGLIFNTLAPAAHPGHMAHLPFYYHWVLGSFAFGAVFMATDPVSAAQTRIGQLIYGLLIGMLIIIIRVANPGFAEGTMLAILFMNAFAPLIDYVAIRRNIARRKKRVAA